jgi:hypothetical protein
VWIAPGFSSFYVGGLSPSIKSAGAILGVGICIPSHLPLEGTGPYPSLLGRNRRAMVPRV